MVLVSLFEGDCRETSLILEEVYFSSGRERESSSVQGKIFRMHSKGRVLGSTRPGAHLACYITPMKVNGGEEDALNRSLKTERAVGKYFSIAIEKAV